MKQEANYQKLNQQLEEILDELQAADLDVDDAVEKYKKGMKIISQLEAHLTQAENKIKKVQTETGK